MKVTVAQFKAALAEFEAGLIKQAKATINQFAMGVFFRRLNRRADEMLAPVIDKDGLVDCDEVRADVNAGMAASGGKIKIEPEIDDRLRWLGVTLVDITVTQDEADAFFDKTIPACAPTEK